MLGGQQTSRAVSQALSPLPLHTARVGRLQLGAMVQLTSAFVGTTFKTSLLRAAPAPSPNATRQVTCMAKKKVWGGGGG